jgi:hypothetical protein
MNPPTLELPPRSHSHRTGRIAFGLVLCIGMLVLAGSALSYGFRPMRIHAWQILGGTWFAAFVIGGLASNVAGSMRRRETTELDADRKRVAAFVVPAVGLALIAPLTIHLVVAILLDPASIRTTSDGFDDWASLALLLTGIAHIAFATLVGMRARALARGAIPIIFGITLALACIPGIVLVLPPVIVALTGIPIVPFLVRMERMAARDRERDIEFPVAIARMA